MARVGIITGSGNYTLEGFEGEEREVETRFGTVLVTFGSFAGADVVHIARHAENHRLLSSHVMHQANVTALAQLGADAVIGVTVCGAVDPDIQLGSLIVFDDLHFLVNRLPDGSLCTLHDEPGATGRGHWIFEDPFSEEARVLVADAVRAAGRSPVWGGCYGHVDGPRFNTKAEIRTLAQAGVTAVSQTAGPEAVLCGEADLPYVLLGFATDYANGVKEEATPVDELLRLIRASREAFASTLARAVPALAEAELPPVWTHYRID
jgi:5'-methylthioadenosine phosphorylase